MWRLAFLSSGYKFIIYYTVEGTYNVITDVYKKRWKIIILITNIYNIPKYSSFKLY